MKTYFSQSQNVRHSKQDAKRTKFEWLCYFSDCFIKIWEYFYNLLPKNHLFSHFLLIFHVNGESSVILSLLECEKQYQIPIWRFQIDTDTFPRYFSIILYYFIHKLSFFLIFLLYHTCNQNRPAI